MSKIKLAKHYVFVYGTLKYGFGNYYGNLTESRFVCNYVLNKSYKLSMYTNGHFPEVIKETKKSLITPIHGEIYEIDAETLYKLDWLENVGSLYDRCEFDFDGEKCYIYIYKDFQSAKDYSVHIKNGIFLG